MTGGLNHTQKNGLKRGARYFLGKRRVFLCSCTADGWAYVTYEPLEFYSLEAALSQNWDMTEYDDAGAFMVRACMLRLEDGQ